MRSARRGLLVVAGGGTASDALAACEIAALLGWAVVADAASGLRVRGAEIGGSSSAPRASSWSAAGGVCPGLLDGLDLALCSPEFREWFDPDVIVQINPRITSKRVQTALERAAIDRRAAWAVATNRDARVDPGHCVSLHVASDASAVATALETLLGGGRHGDGAGGGGGGGGTYVVGNGSNICVSSSGCYVGSDGHASCVAFR